LGTWDYDLAFTLVKGKARVCARSNWIEEARARTDSFYHRGPTGPATWVLTHGTFIPKGAIVVGEEHGRNLYSNRAFYDVSFSTLT